MADTPFEATPGALNLIGIGADVSVPLEFENVVGQLTLIGIHADVNQKALPVRTGGSPPPRRQWPRYLAIKGKKYIVWSYQEEKDLMEKVLKKQGFKKTSVRTNTTKQNFYSRDT